MDASPFTTSYDASFDAVNGKVNVIGSVNMNGTGPTKTTPIDTDGINTSFFAFDAGAGMSSSTVRLTAHSPVSCGNSDNVSRALSFNSPTLADGEAAFV